MDLSDLVLHRARRNRAQLVEGTLPRAQWPRPRLADFLGDMDAYEDYLATMGALDRYCGLEPEKAIIKETRRVKLRNGQLWRLLSRALERDPRMGSICGYWVCKAGWSPNAPPDDPSDTPYGKDLTKLFRAYPDIEAAMCEFCLPKPATRGEQGNVGQPPLVPYLRAKIVWDQFTSLCRSKGLDKVDAWPYMLKGDETSTVGREAIRRWWKKKRFLNPSRAAITVMTKDAAALVTRDFRRLDPKPAHLHIAHLFERAELDEHKVDAMFTALLPMTNGRFKPLATNRLWLLGMVECSCLLRLSFGMSYGRRYTSNDVKKMLYRAVMPAKRFDYRIDHPEYRYRDDACYPSEVEALKNLIPRSLCLDSDSAHLSDDTLDAIKQVLRCEIVNGPAGVPEKNPFAERLFGQFAEMFGWLPSATGNRPDSPARKDPEKGAERWSIIWPLAEELGDIRSRNWNVEASSALGGLSPIQAAQDLLKSGRVFRTGLGEFSAASLYRFLPTPGRDERRPELAFLRGNDTLSPLVVRYLGATYTSFELNEHKDLFYAAYRGVTLYIQEDARFAVVVPDAFPERYYKVAVAGRHAAVAHSREMRRLTNAYAKKAVNQDRARGPNLMIGALGGLAKLVRPGTPAAELLGGMLTFMDRAGHGDLCYIDLTEDEQEQLLAEAAQIVSKQGWTDADEDDVSSQGEPVELAEPSRIWTPQQAVADPFGTINASRFR